MCTHSHIRACIRVIITRTHADLRTHTHAVLRMIASDEEAARKSAENSEAARQQRVKWAEEIKQKALTVSRTCDKNKSSDMPLVSTTYQASSQMEGIVSELTKVAELQGKVDSIADDLTKKGGD